MTSDHELQRLTDIHLISRLKAAYARLVDEKAWSGLEELFAGDFEFDGIWSSRGGHAFVERMSRSLVDASTAHQLGIPEIDVTSNASAQAVWPFADIIDQRSDGLGMYRRGFGHYRETYIKADGSWKIATMRITRVRVECSVFLPGGEVRHRTCLSQEELVAWLDRESRL
jgi:hypothetical protein